MIFLIILWVLSLLYFVAKKYQYYMINKILIERFAYKPEKPHYFSNVEYTDHGDIDKVIPFWDFCIKKWCIKRKTDVEIKLEILSKL
jgi:hypothetical protein